MPAGPAPTTMIGAISCTSITSEKRLRGGLTLGGGIGYVSTSGSSSGTCVNGPTTTTEFSNVDLSLDPMLVITPVSHVGIFVGPTAPLKPPDADHLCARQALRADEGDIRRDEPNESRECDAHVQAEARGCGAFKKIAGVAPSV